MTQDKDGPVPTRAGHVLIFGMGYVGGRFAERLAGLGWRVDGTRRSADVGEAPTGVAVHAFDGSAKTATLAPLFDSVTHVLSCVPPAESGDPVLKVWGPHLRAASRLAWIGYLSTPAVYGDRAGALVDEDMVPTPGSSRGRRRLEAERAWQGLFDTYRAAVHVFRLSGIYGPGRSPFDQIRGGTLRRIDKPGQVFNRIHVDDIVRMLVASMARPQDGALYNVADDLACPSHEVADYACRLANVEPPPLIAFDEAPMGPMAREFYSECKRLRNDRMKALIGGRLLYPTYREGLDAIWHEENT